MSHSGPADVATAMQSLRRAFATFPTGVAVVTARLPNGEIIGATVSSFTSVSLEPPLVLISLARTSRAFPAWESIDGFAVNVLSDRQERISRQFANSLENKWQDVLFINAKATGSPLLDDALAWFECRAWARYDGGDHLILVGQVCEFERREEDGVTPLVFFESRYARLQPLPP